MTQKSRTPENLLDIMGCRSVPAIFTGNEENDNRANTELYLRLVRIGKVQGFCPVLVDKDIKHYIDPSLYGYTDSREDYLKLTKRLIELVNDNCFSVWMGRLIYNYFLEGEEFDEVVEDDLSLLIPPESEEYLSLYKNPAVVKSFCLQRTYTQLVIFVFFQ